MTLEVVEAHPVDARLIFLRKSDYEEAAAWVPGVDPIVALGAAISNSTEAFTGLDGEQVVGIWGYNVTETSVHPWLMCSDLIVKHRHTFTRQARQAIQTLAQRYPDKLVNNYVYRDNMQAKRLLKSLGFVWFPSPGTDKFDFFCLPPCASQQYR